MVRGICMINLGNIGQKYKPLIPAIKKPADKSAGSLLSTKIGII